MSNQAVGNVYQAIIDEVVNSSRVDFEESGVEDSVLEELRQGWQQKLSQLDVAQFPWDPKPEEPPQPPPPPPPQAASAQPPASTAQNGAAAAKDEPSTTVKQEPGQTSMPPPMNFNPMDGKNSVAASRAAQLVQKQYGERAVGSINALQNGQQAQGQGQQSPEALQQAYRQQMAAATAQQSPGQESLQNAQTDGAADEFEGVLLQRDQAGELKELGRVEIDNMLHEQILAKAKAMEGGGLMLPLKEATRHKTMTSSADRKGKGIAGHDGGDDDDDDDVADEDAINSDLDDPDEDRSDDEVDDEGLGHIMLCMYDKVQRVKNKWKCTLKDGVLTVNGKEYVFHKATGEYEW